MSSEMDVTMEGDVNLPTDVNMLQFIEARVNEINSLTRALEQPKGNGLVFQRLPRHMRRRVMGHTSNRMPRSVREAHINQLKKSGDPIKSKRPSRRHRRRPKNLLSEYNRRQKTHVWLETHIWHAKRFRMVERWGYKLPEHSYDKTVRACYRASKKHVLLNDLSYYVCIELSGPEATLLAGLSQMDNPKQSSAFAAPNILAGFYQGSAMVYKQQAYPYGAIGYVDFIWKPNTDEQRKSLWIWCHPSFYEELLEELKKVFNLEKGERQESKIEAIGIEAKKLEPRLPPLVFRNDSVELKLLKDTLVRFRLTGGLSHAILRAVLKPAPEMDLITSTQSCSTQSWSHSYYTNNLEEGKTQLEIWKSTNNILDPALMPPNCVLALTVLDPRYFMPGKRTKANATGENQVRPVLALAGLASKSPIWDESIRDAVTSSKQPDHVINSDRQKLLVPGTEFSNKLTATRVPVLLIQRSGTRFAGRTLREGVFSGWDVILPLGWAMPFWRALLMNGARVGGLRQLQALSLECSAPYEPLCVVDTSAGKAEQARVRQECLDEYFKKPPNKRLNYNKIGIYYPFGIPWLKFIKDSSPESPDFFVLRDQTKLELLRNHQVIEAIPNALILVSVTLMHDKGALSPWAVIHQYSCKLMDEFKSRKFVDKNEQMRKVLRNEHDKKLMKLRRLRAKAKESESASVNSEEAKILCENFKQEMQKLWIPECANVNDSFEDKVMGFVTQASFGFSVGHAIGLGYVTMEGLIECLKSKKQDKILVRNNNSLEFRRAKFVVL